MNDEVLQGLQPDAIGLDGWNPKTHRLWGFGMAQWVEFTKEAELDGPKAYGLQRYWCFKKSGGKVRHSIERAIANSRLDMRLSLRINFEIEVCDQDVLELVQFQANEGARWKWQEPEMWNFRLKPIVETYLSKLGEHGHDLFEEVFEIIPGLSNSMNAESGKALGRAVVVSLEVVNASEIGILHIREERLMIGEGAQVQEVILNAELVILEVRKSRAVAMYKDSRLVRAQAIQKVRESLEAEARDQSYLMKDTNLLQQRISNLLNIYLETYGREVRGLELSLSGASAGKDAELFIQDKFLICFQNLEAPQEVGSILRANMVDPQKWRIADIQDLDIEARRMVKAKMEGVLSGMRSEDAIVSKLENLAKIHDGIQRWLASIGYHLEQFDYSVGTDVPEYGDQVQIQWREAFPMLGGQTKLQVEMNCIGRVRDLKVWKPRIREGVDVKAAMNTEFKSVVERYVRKVSPAIGAEDLEGKEVEVLIRELRQLIQNAAVEMGLMQLTVSIHLGTNPLATKLTQLKANILEMDFSIPLKDSECSYRLYYQVSGVADLGWQSASICLSNDVSEVSKRINDKVHRKLQYLLDRAHQERVAEMDDEACKQFMAVVVHPNLTHIAEVIGFKVRLLDFFPKESETQEIARQQRIAATKLRLKLQQEQAAKYNELLRGQFEYWKDVLERCLKNPTEHKGEIETLANEKVKFLLHANPATLGQ
jgi:hypothetical protein